MVNDNAEKRCKSIGFASSPWPKKLYYKLDLAFTKYANNGKPKQNKAIREIVEVDDVYMAEKKTTESEA